MYWPYHTVQYGNGGEFLFIIARHGWPSGINLPMGKSSTMDEDGLVLRASLRSTRAPILARLGARSQDRDPAATSSSRHVAAFATTFFHPSSRITAGPAALIRP